MAWGELRGLTTASGHIVPGYINQLDLGTASKPWRNIHVAGTVSGINLNTFSSSVATALNSVNAISASYVSGSNVDGTVNNALTASYATQSNTVYENRAGGSLSFWQGTQAQYNAIGSKDSNTIYLVE